MTEKERKTIMILADTIQGEINRMCVTKDLSELDTMHAHARKNLDELSQMIYNARFRQGELMQLEKNHKNSRYGMMMVEHERWRE